jgi:hypothetical protein
MEKARTAVNEGEPDTAGEGGLLAGTAAAWAYGRVHLQPVPQIVPAGLKAVTSPVLDDDGHLIDWRLDPAALIASGEEATLRSAYRSWRAVWLRQARLGDGARIRQFLTWAAGSPAAPGLSPLAHLPGRVGPVTALGLARAAQLAGARARADSRLGVGLAAPGRPGLLRAFLAEDTVLLLGRPGAGQVWARGDRLGVSWGGRGGQELVSLPCTGWVLTGAGMAVLTADGQVRVPEEVGSLLTRLAPGQARVGVHPVPVTSVFAELITELPDLARLAHQRGRALRVDLVVSPTVA